MAYEVGSRVFAVESANNEQVRLYGKGVYEGDFVPPGWPGGPDNPRIKLDNGDIVWGYQCWWGPEERYDQWVKGRVIIEVPTPEKENTDA